MIAFEYRQPTERNGKTVSLHNNYYDERTGQFNHPLFSNGYFPIALIQDDIVLTDEWDKFCDWLHLEQPSATVAMDTAYKLLAKIASRS